MTYISRLLSILFLLIASGCGKASSKRDDQAIVLPERVFYPPASYQLEDEQCQTQSDYVGLTSSTLPAWQADAVNMVHTELADTYSSSSLRNGIVKETVFGVEYERRCDASKKEGTECLDQMGRDIDYDVVEGKGWYLRICKNGYPYGRKSVETVALTSAHYLDLAHKKYMSLKDPGADIPNKLLLNVLPIFTDVHENYVENGIKKVKKEHLVHNLAYYGSKDMIIVFPESKEKDRTLPGYFWESQFVLGHEYGHHIEKLRTGLFTEHLGIEWNSITHSWEDLGSLKITGSGATEFTQMLGSVSEGFADLLAFYAEGGTAYSLIGIPNLGQNRDIRAATFANKEGKILTSTRLDLLTGRSQPQSDRDPERSFTDIHTVGAVLAHAANKIFRSVSISREGIVEGSDEDMNYRYKLLLQWIDLTGEGLSLTKDENAEVHLAKISDAFASVVADALGSFQLRSDTSDEAVQRQICTVLSEHIPAMTKPAFSLSGGGCQ